MHDHLYEGNPVTRAVNVVAGTPLVLPYSRNREAIMISADRSMVATVLVRFTVGETVTDGIPILTTMPGLVLWRRLYGPFVNGPIVIDSSVGTARVYIAEVLGPGCECDTPIGSGGAQFLS